MLSFVNWPISDGMIPVRVLFCSCRDMSCVQLVMKDDEISPESILPDIPSSDNFVRLDREGGKAPVRLLVESSMKVRLVHWPSSDGIVEFNPALMILSLSSIRSWPIEEGRGPINEFS